MTMIGNNGSDLASLYRSMPSGGTLTVTKQDEVNAERLRTALNTGADSAGLNGSTHGSVNVRLNPNASEQVQKGEERVAAVDAKYAEMVSATRAQTSEEGEATGASPAKSLKDLEPLMLFNQEDVDNYNEKLFDKLSSLGVDTSQPIDFGFSYDGRVVVNNDHPDKTLIEKTFNEDMELRNGLVKTSQFFLFQELFDLSEQWASKIESGVSEKVAGEWLINAAKSAARSSDGVHFSDGKAQDPFAGSTNRSLATKAYGS